MSSVGQICTLNCSKCPPPYSFQCRLSILSFFVQYNEKRIKLGAPRAIREVASNICCNFECMISANPNFSFFLAHMLPKELFVFLKNVQETLKNRVCTGRWSPHIKQWELREAFFVHWSIFAEKSSDMSSIPALSWRSNTNISARRKPQFYWRFGQLLQMQKHSSEVIPNLWPRWNVTSPDGIFSRSLGSWPTISCPKVHRYTQLTR